MARQLRVEYEGAIYHLMSRGDRKEPIFWDDEDRRRFVETLGEACAKAGWQVHAYCLMGNHFHLLVETPQRTLVSGMKWFLGTYTQRFNARHQLRGRLFAGRYKAILVDGSEDSYLLRAVCNYVRLNPVRSGLIDMGKMLNDDVSGRRIEATNDDDCCVNHPEIEYRHPRTLLGALRKLRSEHDNTRDPSSGAATHVSTLVAGSRQPFSETRLSI